jgi:hypothetical protein
MHFSNVLQSTTYDCCVIIADVTNVFEVLVFSADIKYIQVCMKILPKVRAIFVGKGNVQAGPRVKPTFFYKVKSAIKAIRMTRIRRYFHQIEEKFKSFHFLQSWDTEQQQPVFVYSLQTAYRGIVKGKI